MPSALVIKLLSNPRIPINTLACGEGISWNSRVANQLNNLTSGIDYYLICIIGGCVNTLHMSTLAKLKLYKHIHQNLPQSP